MAPPPLEPDYRPRPPSDRDRWARDALTRAEAGVGFDALMIGDASRSLKDRLGRVAYVYTGVKDGTTQRDVVRVTRRTRKILGVTCTVVTDLATHRGTVLEQTTDWYAQDEHGNVWYFGEATRARNPDGTYDTSGSWLAGAHGARPGIVTSFRVVDTTTRWRAGRRVVRWSCSPRRASR